MQSPKSKRKVMLYVKGLLQTISSMLEKKVAYNYDLESENFMQEGIYPVCYAKRELNKSEVFQLMKLLQEIPVIQKD